LLYDEDYSDHTDPASVAVPWTTGDDPLTAAGLFVARIAANDFFAGVQTDWGTTGNFFYNASNQTGTDLSAYLLYFQIVKPAPIILTAADFNTLLQTKSDPRNDNYNRLTFTLDKINVNWPNPWSDYELRAEDVSADRVTAIGTQFSATIPDNWLQFKARNDMKPATPTVREDYLRVDTVYTENYADRYLTFNFGTTPFVSTTGRAAANNVVSYADGDQLLEAQYYFRLEYNVYNDSLGIDVMQARYVLNKGDWFNENSPGLPTAPTIKTWETYATSASGTPWSDPSNDPMLGPTNPWEDADYLHVGLVGIDGDKARLITIRPPKVNTYAQLGLGGCLNDNLFDSIEEGLYVVVNGGMALGVPINTDTIEWRNSVYPPVFTNLYGIQDPQQMPSYQWVVKKLRKSRPELSPIIMINREFPNIRYSPVQLLKENGAVTIDDIHRPGVTVRKNFFVKVEKKYSTDPHLGYFYIDDRTARLSSYDLNYLHNFASDRYLGVGGAGKVNGLAIQVDPYQWTFRPVEYINSAGDPTIASVAYGYQPTEDDEDYLFISPLVRTAYEIRGGNANNSDALFIDDQKTYVRTPWQGRTGSLIPPDPIAGITDYGIFLIKTQNTKDGKNYYALLDTNSYYGRIPFWDADLTTPDVHYNYVGEVDFADNLTKLGISYTKVGIADGSVVAYAQPQDEVRTSAFHIGVYHAPLYRRFDGGSYTYANGPAKVKEVYSGDDPDDKDSPLFLRFHDIVQDWMFLYENSPANAANKFRTNLTNTNISFLGLNNKVQFPELDKDAAQEGDYAVNYEFYVDTAFVKRTVDGHGGPDVTPEEYTPMPQYMLALRPEIKEAGWVYWEEKTNIWYEEDEKWEWTDTHPGESLKDSMMVPHLVRGFYLFNAADSIARGLGDYRGKLEDNIENDIRLAFVDGVHLGDTFYVLPASYKTRSASYFQREPEKWLYNLPWYKKHYLGENTHYERRWFIPSGASIAPVEANSVEYYDADGNPVYRNGKSMVFQFRLRNVGQTGGNPKRDFYIESEVRGGNEIGPDQALFVNNHNGAPIVTSLAVSFPRDVTNNNEGALGLNVTKESTIDYGKATAIEAISTESAKVIGNTGSVTILNASGKTVTVTNVLGQTVAKAVLSGNNETIALPKGIVVVKIDGASSKALVK
jgi:hypothetical protein